MRYRTHSLPLFAALAFLSAAHAEQNFDFAELERTAVDEIMTTKTPGATVAVISGERVVFSKAFGVANSETQEPVTTDMLFRLASTTKMFTAAALVQLAEQGKIKLDEPIGRYVKGLDPRVAALTADQVLSHKTGLLHESPQYGLQDESALAEGIRKWREDRFFADSGTIFSYSNLGYWLAGLLIEEVSGKRFADELSDGLFKPLGMSRSTFRPMIALTYPTALGHEVPPTGTTSVVRPMANNAATWPAGSMFSNVDDLSRFVIAFLNEGSIDGHQVLSPSLIATLSSAHADIPGTEKKYGYGLFLDTYRGMRTVEHSGARLGHGSLIRMVPKHKIAVIVLTNRSGGQLPRTVTKAMEIVLPRAAAPEDQAPMQTPMDATEMKRHIGLYSQGAMKIEILMRDGKIFALRDATQFEIIKVVGARYRALLPNVPEPADVGFVAGSDGRTQFVTLGGGFSFKRKE